MLASRQRRSLISTGTSQAEVTEPRDTQRSKKLDSAIWRKYVANSQRLLVIGLFLLNRPVKAASLICSPTATSAIRERRTFPITFYC